MRRGEIAAIVCGWPMLLVREGTMHPGHVLIGSINHLPIAVMGQPIRHREITGMPALVGHLPHRYRLKMRVGGPFDLFPSPTNWLPAPAGPFFCVLRLYWPKEEALNGTWKQPPLEKQK